MRKTKNAPAVSILLSLMFVLANIGTANSESAQTYTFNLPAQPLLAALKAFAEQTDVQLLYKHEVVKQLTASAVVGKFEKHEALKQLLKDTGLEGVFTTDNAATIRPHQPTAINTNDDALNTDAFKLAQNAVAARSTETPVGPEDNSKPQEILVTGTHIRGVSNVAAPTMTFTREDIERTGYSSTAQLFQSLPQNLNELSADGAYGNGISRLAGSNGEGATGISLRGLGPEATLVMVNGQRRPGVVTGRVVDISAIPLSAIERVEIVTGGRSAIYGSDAVAGVVNLVTRRDFEGAETQAFFGRNESGGDRLQASQIVGFKGENAGMMAAYDFTRENSLSIFATGVTQPSPDGYVISHWDLLPASQRHSGLISGHWEPSETVELRADGLYSKDSRIFEAGYGLPGVFDYAYISDVGSDEYSGSLGALIHLGQDWTANVSGLYGGSRVESFVTVQTSPTNFDSIDKARLSQGSAVIEGPVMRWSGAVVRTAFGAEYRKESLESVLFFNQVFDSASNNGRHVTSVFDELYIPVPTRLVPNKRELEFSLAARYDDYSDFGDTFNPQAGVVWQLTEGLRFKGAYSTAFRAPSFSDLTVENQILIQRLTDPSAPSGTSAVMTWVGGSAGLQPEKAKTWSTELEYQPASLPHTRFSLAYFDIHYRDRIDQPLLINSSVLTQESNYAALITRNPTAAQVNTVLASTSLSIINGTGTPFDRNTQDALSVFPGLILFDNRRANLASDHNRGLDLAADTTIPLAASELQFGVKATYYLAFDRQTTNTSPSFSQLNLTGRPTDFRLRANAGWLQGPLSAFVYLNYVDDYKDPFATPERPVASWSTFDLSFTWDTAKTTVPRPFQDITVNLAVTNALGKKPPVLLSNTYGYGYDGANANALGRILGLRLTKAFR